ncbi:MAG: MFS transporter [Rubripirellula sp.]
MSTIDDSGITPNAKRLLWAGFMAILAAGVGFAIRGGILDNWASEYGFTNTELGKIGGAGFTGFCFGIFIGGLIVDKIGYGKLIIAAFVFHFLSAVVTFLPTEEMSKDTVYNYLYWGTFLFAVANGTLEAVANPLVATLFPKQRTHYLNILHASWPAGLVLGSAMGWVLDDAVGMYWKWQLALFLLPTVVYGIMFLGQRFPKSEASERGLSLAQMFKEIGLLGGAVACFLIALFFGEVLKPVLADNAQYVGYAIGAVLLVAVGFLTKFSIGSALLFVLFVTHALVGAVELGTDGWIQNITGNILSSGEGKMLFVYTSTIMFLLRFSAHFIEKKLGLSPIGILFVCAILGCVGLQLAAGINGFGYALVALGVYAVGKTFFWPTMLAVVGDRFPRTGAVAMSLMGGIGMMSAGLLGSQGLGFAKDKYSGEALAKVDQVAYDEYKAAESSEFLIFEATGLDGTKVEEAKAAETPTDVQKKVAEASITGDRNTLKIDSFIPGTMAIIYLLLMLYFMTQGGYKPVHIDQTPEERAAEEAAEAAATTAES